jgi:predicted DNA-binding protein (MmcQ/YjbR family)
MSKKTHTAKRAKVAGLTTNSAPVSAPVGPFAAFSVNRKVVPIRNAKLAGKEYKVVPMVMITEGVHAGSNGPLYYPKGELSKTPATWNHKPVTIRHPFDAAGARSACDSDMIEEFSVGIIMNAKFDKNGDRITAEAWIDEARLDEVKGGDKVKLAMANNQTLELSTGLFTDNETKSGDFDGTHYDTIARNYRPDHLAILPDDVGACDKTKGAGFIRNAKLAGKELTEIEQRMAEAAGLGFIANALSFGQVADQIYTLLRSKLNTDTTKDCCYPWVRDTYETVFIYSYEGKMYAQKYTKSDTDKITFDGEPVEVVQYVTYKDAVSGSLVVNNNITNSHTEDTHMKDKYIAKLIANGYSEADRVTLNSKSEAELGLMVEAADKAAVANKAPEVKPVTEPVANAAQDKVIADLKAKVDALTANAASEAKKEKDAVIAGIVANKANKRSAEDLAKFDVDALRVIAEAFGTAKPVANYKGQGEVPSGEQEGNEAPTGNAADVLGDGGSGWSKDEAK